MVNKLLILLLLASCSEPKTTESEKACKKELNELQWSVWLSHSNAMYGINCYKINWDKKEGTVFNKASGRYCLYKVEDE